MSISHRERLRDDATVACLRAGAIKQCPQHEDMFISAPDREPDRNAYRIGAIMVENGAANGTQDEMSAAVASVLDSTDIECPMCEMDQAA